MRDASIAASGTLLPWVSQKASSRFAWVRWVVTGNLPLSFCESQYTKLNPISVTTLTSLMEALTKAVETTIGEEMPDDFGLIIDGWTHAPVMDEPDDHLNADGHMMAISNKRIANLLRVPLIGCASHRLNLAVREYLEPYDSNLEHALVIDLLDAGTLLPAERIYSADEEDMGDFLPSRATHRKLATLLVSLRDVESVSKRLQADGMTLLDARDLFDALIEIRPAFANYSAPDANIIHSVAFEKATVKVLASQAAMLTEEETTTLEPFKREPTNVTAAAPSSSSKEGVLKRRKVSAERASYILLHAIPSTSNIVEGFLALRVLCYATSANACRK
ncbi:hypothetical protein JG687_00008950 [Phytophthora cactorum]|uniref:Uncharacterized protein n=1 Tax=Phytophthora cactorum TaxID=29920 RepID=A0A8T1UG04_9STRA|nr:hypothetical protein JG687_00008950 [Phytophthora cactorum]